jgi:hypothetical protein
MISAKLSLGANDKAAVGRGLYARPFLFLFYPHSPEVLRETVQKGSKVPAT